MPGRWESSEISQTALDVSSNPPRCTCDQGLLEDFRIHIETRSRRFRHHQATVHQRPALSYEAGHFGRAGFQQLIVGDGCGEVCVWITVDVAAPGVWGTSASAGLDPGRHVPPPRETVCVKILLNDIDETLLDEVKEIGWRGEFAVGDEGS